MTRNTPGIAFAARVSIALMRLCGTVERNTLPCSMPGSRIRCVYSARPVTFSRASRRGTERPIWPPPIGFVDITYLAPLHFAPSPKDGGAWAPHQAQCQPRAALFGGCDNQ